MTSSPGLFRKQSLMDLRVWPTYPVVFKTGLEVLDEQNRGSTD